MARKPLPFATKLLWISLFSFGLALPIVITVGGFGAVILSLGGGARVIAELYQMVGSFGIVGGVLLGALLLAVALTAVAAVPAWIFHKGPDAADDDAPSSWRALLPDLGVVCVCAAMAVTALYLVRPPQAYRYWNWLEYAPWVGALLLLAGVLTNVLRWRRNGWALPAAWWRLRAVLALLAGALAVSAIGTLRQETHACARDVLNAVIITGDAAALDRHITRHAACQGEPMNRAMYDVVMNIAPVEPAKMVSAQRHEVLLTLQRHGGTLGRGAWNIIASRGTDDSLRELLSVLQQAPPQADVWAESRLGESAVKWANWNEVATLSLFAEYGLRLDTPDWRVKAYGVMDTALAKKEPSWAFYDALVGAGLPASSRMQALAQVIRSGSTVSLREWTPQDWQGRVIDGDANSASLVWAAAMYTQSDALRAELLALAGTDTQQLAAATPLPRRCQLALRTGAAPIRATLEALPDDDVEKFYCERYLENYGYK